MIMEKAHKKLKAWKEAMEVVKTIYGATTTLPQEEKYGLVSQMRRAAVSVPSNIAEGAPRQSAKESIQFYMIARGSLSELDTQVELCSALGLLDSSQLSTVSAKLTTVDGLLSGLIRFKKGA
jgi:four helix bundle protein